LRKKIARTEGFKAYKKIIDKAKFTEEKIQRLKARSDRLMSRIEKIEPSGWKEFLQVIQEYYLLQLRFHKHCWDGDVFYLLPLHVPLMQVVDI